MPMSTEGRGVLHVQWDDFAGIRDFEVERGGA
jgi:hypothetical protein